MGLGERFWSKVDRTPTCWLWTAGLRHGYGSYKLDRRDRYAHRLAYEDLIGPIPHGLSLDHLCKNKACVNPSHLEPVTHTVNMQRACQLKVASCGHPMVVYGGKRMCRDCRRVYLNEYQQKRRREAGAVPGGPGVVNRSKTHCKRGHAFDTANTHIDVKGRRTCRTCRKMMQQVRCAR